MGLRGAAIIWAIADNAVGSVVRLRQPANPISADELGLEYGVFGPVGQEGGFAAGWGHVAFRRTAR